MFATDDDLLTYASMECALGEFGNSKFVPVSMLDNDYVTRRYDAGLLTLHCCGGYENAVTLADYMAYCSTL